MTLGQLPAKAPASNVYAYPKFTKFTVHARRTRDDRTIQFLLRIVNTVRSAEHNPMATRLGG